MKTNEWLNAVRKSHGLQSDYALAKLLGCSTSKIANYRAGGGMEPYVAAKVAQALGIDPLKVIASAEAERARNTEKKDFWKRLAACVVVGTATTVSAPPSAEASGLHNHQRADNQREIQIMRHSSLLKDSLNRYVPYARHSTKVPTDSFDYCVQIHKIKEPKLQLHHAFDLKRLTD